MGMSASFSHIYEDKVSLEPLVGDGKPKDKFGFVMRSMFDAAQAAGVLIKPNEEELKRKASLREESDRRISAARQARKEKQDALRAGRAARKAAKKTKKTKKR